MKQTASDNTLKAAVAPGESVSIWSRSFIILFFANMAFNMGLNMSNSLLSLYASELGATAAIIGLVYSSFGISSIVFRMFAAPVMDTYNRKYLVVLAALMMSAAFWGFSAATGIPMLVGFRLLQGCGMVFGNACCLAMVSEMLPKHKYNSGIGYYSLAQVICTAAGPSIGLELVALAGFRVTYMVAACFMLVAGLLTCLIKTDFTRTKTLKLRLDSIIAKEALLPAGFQFLMIFAGAGVFSFLYLYAGYKGITGNIGLYFTVSAITMLVTRPLVGRLTDKFGLVKIVIPAVFCSALSLFVISWSASLIGLLLAAFIAAFGQGAFGPAIQALTMKSVPNERRGAASSTNFVAQDLGALIGPTITGRLVESFGYNTMWQVMVVPYILGALLLFLFRSKIAHIEEAFYTR